MIVAIAAAAAAAAATPPRVLSSHDPQSIVNFLHGEGYKAQLDKDGEGDPMIRSGAAGSDFAIFFYGCDNHVKCKDVQFSIGFDTDDGKGPSLQKINDWNYGWRFSRAFLDKEQDPTLQMDVMFSKGEMPADLFLENLELWADELGTFKKHIDW